MSCSENARVWQQTFVWRHRTPLQAHNRPANPNEGASFVGLRTCDDDGNATSNIWKQTDLSPIFNVISAVQLHKRSGVVGRNV